MGADPNSKYSSKKPRAKKTIAYGKTEREAITWKIVDADQVGTLVQTVTNAGGAVMFSRSSDGGALGVRVYHDDIATKTMWCTDADEWEELCVAVQHALD